MRVLIWFFLRKYTSGFSRVYKCRSDECCRGLNCGEFTGSCLFTFFISYNISVLPDDALLLLLTRCVVVLRLVYFGLCLFVGDILR